MFYYSNLTLELKNLIILVFKFDNKNDEIDWFTAQIYH